MEYIISKGAELPNTEIEMETAQWFNMWSTRKFPYNNLIRGDILYWLDTVTGRLVWKTVVFEVERYPYLDKEDIFKLYGQSMRQQYFNTRSLSGYFLRYKVKVIQKIDVTKPNEKFDRLGWVEMNENNYAKWFSKTQLDDTVTLDDNLDVADSTINVDDSLKCQLQQLSKKMRYVSPNRIEKLVINTIRKDTRMIKAIKEAAKYKCQFPGCGHQIRKKDGSFYIEVAHISPVKENGKSILGNLVVLCPNHHKEFDYGDRTITNQTENELVGMINGNYFSIHFSYD
jgi:hypothetical protein